MTPANPSGSDPNLPNPPDRGIAQPEPDAPGRTRADSVTGCSEPNAHVLVAVLLLLTAAVVGLIVPGALLIWEATQPSVVTATGSAGAFESATSSPGSFFAPTLTSVQTTAGTVTVTNTFSALRGSHLVVEAHNKSATLQLCVVGTSHVCAPLAGPWAGVLVPTPAAAHAIAFARHGLSTADLQRWLGLGVLATLMSLLIVGLAGAPDLNAKSSTSNKP